MNKKVRIAALSTACVLLLSGCNSAAGGQYTIEQINSMQRAGIGSTGELTANTKLAVNATDEELRGMVYNFVSNNLHIDLDALIMPADDDIALITEHVSRIVDALKGKKNDSITDDMLNYMLWEFAKTQNEWTLAPNGVTLLGQDAATNRTFVDITFVTTNDFKKQLPESSIVVGSPLEDIEKAKRKEEYLTYMNADYELKNFGMSTATSTSIFAATNSDETKAKLEEKRDETRKTFVSHWGEVDAVLDEQQEWSMIERIREKIRLCDGTLTLNFDDEFLTNKGLSRADMADYRATTPLTSYDLQYVSARGIGTYTYSGIAKQTRYTGYSATMTFRFVFDFKKHLGTATSMETDGVYLRSYTIDNYDAEDGPMSRFSVDNKTADANLVVISPYVDRLINRYQKCVEENDYKGLYKLFGQQVIIKDEYTGEVSRTAANFKDWDKYYNDMGTYCYIKYDGYDFKIVDWNESAATLTVKVTRRKKIRGKGTNMTMPTYLEESLMTMYIDNDDLFVKDEEILKTECIGEPVSMLKDINGMAEKLAFSKAAFSEKNEAAVLGALQVFSNAQLDYAHDYTGDASTNTASFGVPDNTPGCIYMGVKDKISLLNTMGKIADKPPVEKITHVITWATRSNSYCKLRLRELFLFGDNAGVVTESYVGLTNNNGVWSIVSYDRTSAEYYNVTGKSEADLHKGCLCHDFYGDKASTSDYESNDSTLVPDQSVQATDTQNKGKTLTLAERADASAGSVTTAPDVDLPPAVTSVDSSTEETTTSSDYTLPGDEIVPAETTAVDPLFQTPTETTETAAPVDTTQPAESTTSSNPLDFF